MGFLSSLKRLFFATESVAKSAVEKGVEYTKEKSKEVLAEGKEAMQNLDDKTSGLRESLAQKAEELKDKAEVLVDKAENWAEKAGETITETGKKAWEKAGDLADKAEDFAEEAGAKITETSHKAWDKVEDLKERAGDKMEEIKHSLRGEDKDVPDTGIVESTPSDAVNLAGKDPSTLEKMGDFAEKIGDKVMETGSQVFEKTGDLAEKVTEKVVETSNVVWDKTADIAEKVGEKVMESGESLLEKAKDLGSKIEEKFEETVAKAQKFEAEEAAKPKKDFADETLDASGSLLKDKDDFFNKASQYAEGHYDAFSEGKVVVNENPDNVTKADGGDKDVDGLIDDAIVVKE